MALVFALILAIVGAVIGAGVGYIMAQKASQNARKTIDELVLEMKNNATLEAEQIIKEAKLKAKEEAIKMREDFEQSTRDRKLELHEVERRYKERETTIDKKMDIVQNRLDEVMRREKEIDEIEKRFKSRQHELDEISKKQIVQLEGIAMLTRDQARVQIMQKLEQDLVNDRGVLIRRHLDELKQKCKKESQVLMIQAMQKFASECANERTTATVALPSDEMKGRIIGRDGRNIRVFEAETGVNVLIDDTPSAVVLTCFEPTRLEIARLAMEKLVEDGRIHPTRVEEVVNWAKTEVESELVRAAEEAIHELRIGHVNPQVISVLGKLKFRYSYSQNVLKHSIEVAKFMSIIAAELGLNVEKAKRMGLFHDIGKALDDEIEGPHAMIGREFLKRAGEDSEVVNGVGCHHGDIPAETPLASLVSVCDAMSASRPGARSETNEVYIKRLEQLEQIGKSFNGIESCYAVQAGRELRVIVEPAKMSEGEAHSLSRDICLKIESEMQYPGQIKVCVIRETRAIVYAR